MTEITFAEAARIVINHRHGALLALEMYDRDPESVSVFLRAHAEVPAHDIIECPWVGKKGEGDA